MSSAPLRRLLVDLLLEHGAGLRLHTPRISISYLLSLDMRLS